MDEVDPYCPPPPKKKLLWTQPITQKSNPKLKNDGWGDNDDAFAEHVAMLNGSDEDRIIT